MANLVDVHERCTCSHCRCQHFDGYQGCTICQSCVRYTWPGENARLAPDHLTKEA